MNVSTKTICPYCGVGCGVLAKLEKDGSVSIAGDKTHPANHGRLCSKGAALGETVSMEGRLLTPYVYGKEVEWDSAIQAVAEGFQRIVSEHGPDSIAFYLSGQLLTEDYYLANKLIKGFIGTANVDTNSRLCMSSTVAGHKRAFGSDTVPCSYEDLEKAKLVVLTGSNAAWCHPVLFQRLVKAKKDNPDLKIVVIDPRKTTSCDIADLHVAIKPGTDVKLFNGLLVYLEQSGELNSLFVDNFSQGMEDALASAKSDAPNIKYVAQTCGLTEKDVEKFYQLFAGTERVVTVYSQGVNQSSQGVDKVNSIINCHLFTGRIGRPGMGPFSFTGQTNAMGGREVGGLSNQLAAHMDIENETHREIVQTFWSSPTMPSKAGLKAVDLFQKIKEGEIKAVWIMCTNPVVSLPNADSVREALNKCEMVVVSDCVNTDTTQYADILLPVATWGEKSGTVTNSERRISRQRSFLEKPKGVKADWEIIRDVALRMGFVEGFSFTSEAQVFREHAALSGVQNNGSRDFDISGMANLDDAAYEKLKPIQWPVAHQADMGTARMFGDGKFFTPSKKAQFIAVTHQSPKNATSEEFPFILNTGRCRDQWHTMTRTGRSPRLAEHAPEPYAELHPQDASKIGATDNELVNISSRWGKIIVRLRVKESQQPGNVFVPIHWNDHFASCARVDSVVNPETDKISGQPEFKHTPVQINVYKPTWHGFLLSRREMEISGASYWAKATGRNFSRYEIAGEQSPEDWPLWAREILCANDEDVNWVEFLDKSRGHYRGIRLVGNKIESCIFIAPDLDLPSRAWLSSLFKKDSLDNQERSSLLSGKAPAGQVDTGPRICACHGVGLNIIKEAIKNGATTVEQIGELTKAGTNCGSCIPELKQLLA